MIATAREQITAIERVIADIEHQVVEASGDPKHFTALVQHRTGL
jgi:hypothetical protein